MKKTTSVWNKIKQLFKVRKQLPAELAHEFEEFKDVLSIDRILTAAWIGSFLTICVLGLDAYRVLSDNFYTHEYYPVLFKIHLLGFFYFVIALYVSRRKTTIIQTRLGRGIVIWGMVALTIPFLLLQSVFVYLDRDTTTMFLGYVFVSSWLFSMSHKERILFYVTSMSVMAWGILKHPGLSLDDRLISFLEIFFLSLISYFFDGYDYNQKVTNFLSQLQVKTEQERIRLLEEFKSRFFTNLTHEFRTPLTTIIGMSGEIAEDPDRWASEGTTMIRQNADSLLNLVNQILDLSKMEAGTIPLHTIQGDIVSFTGYVIDSLKGHALNKQITLHFLCNDDQLLMDFDPDKYTIILSNLISNAVKFSPEKGNIYVSLSSRQTGQTRYADISVKDNGIGIPSEELDNIFERFYQVDTPVSASGIGTGVGLSLARELVQLFKGTIQVVSTLGKGTQFTVSLPVTNHGPIDRRIYSVSAQARLDSIDQNLFADLATGKNENDNRPEILIIEDNTDVLKYLRICLGDLYQLSIAKDGGAGTALAINTVPDLILSDVLMPVKDGLAVCRELKRNPVTSHIPIILLSAKADSASRIAGIESGADVYITKPFEKNELRAQIRNLLDRFNEYHLRYANPEAIPAPAAHEHVEVEDEFITRVRNLVHEHLDDSDFSVHDLERGVFLSRSQLHKKLKALTGLSAMQFVNRIRLSTAREKLKSDNQTISEIAYQVGYTDPNYFSRAYSDEFGETPSETRNNHKNKVL